MSESVYLSVVIPSYKEGKRIGRTLLDIDEYLRSKDYSYEIIVVVDGSPDDTAQVVRNHMSQVQNLRVIDNPENHGKGYVVRQGLLEAKGEYRLFMDADGSTSISHLDRLFPEFEKGFDLVIGSRDIPGSFVQIHQPRHKEIFGDMGNWAIRILLGLWRFPDTQCGFKMMRSTVVKEVVSKMVVDRFGFDFEMLALARYKKFRVSQVPVRWLNDDATTVTLTGPNGYVRVLYDLVLTRWRLFTGFYNE
ncbi:MAG: glycosyltransferase family 2 protein [Candidatus Moranbacteria bacterium]|nr:glycosyltransferase family 2 protein [Candidatus Moranbacteria bacterium]